GPHRRPAALSRAGFSSSSSGSRPVADALDGAGEDIRRDGRGVGLAGRVLLLDDRAEERVLLGVDLERTVAVDARLDDRALADELRDVPQAARAGEAEGRADVLLDDARVGGDDGEHAHGRRVARERHEVATRVVVAGARG